MMNVLVCFAVALVGPLASLPLIPEYELDGYHWQRSPHRAMVLSGYYTNPSFPSTRYGFVPEGQMTAVVSGDTVATNSYSGKHPENDDVNENREPIEPEQPVQGTETQPSVDITPPPKANVPKRKAAAPSRGEEDDEGSWPFRGVPPQNTFFPIYFGGYRSSNPGRSNGGPSNPEEGGYPGAATAIANSFSTGRGGVASSRATAYGDPYANRVMRDGYGFGKNGQKEDFSY